METTAMNTTMDCCESQASPMTSRRALLLGGASFAAWAYLPKFARAASGRDPRLVVVILRGALDGLATVAPVGDPDYARNAKLECKAYVEAIRKVCGKEPEGAKLTIKGQEHDFVERYYEVAVIYDGNNQAAAEYAAKVDREAPGAWEEAGMVAPVQKTRGRL